MLRPEYQSCRVHEGQPPVPGIPQTVVLGEKARNGHDGAIETGK